jgi:uncharacterized phage protein (TIGR02216 family)
VFRDDAARLAGFAGALLGWSPDEFWRATPAELASILEVAAGASGAGGAGSSADPADLDRLRRMFPDG